MKTLLCTLLATFVMS